jgi:hypothetical protein
MCDALETKTFPKGQVDRVIFVFDYEVWVDMGDGQLQCDELSASCEFGFCAAGELSNRNDELNDNGLFSNTDVILDHNTELIAPRKLNLYYLWIDSLCIIQDSSEDWPREAARMTQVYKNAFVTISAASATDCAQGFLQERQVTRLAGTESFSFLSSTQIQAR